MLTNIRLIVLSALLAFQAIGCSDDDEPTCENDEDGDGYGTGTGCHGEDCDDNNPECWVGMCCLDSSNCTDEDSDGAGVGPDCTNMDCDDHNPDCWEVGDECCPAQCSDSDEDGYGAGADCLGPDCDDSNDTCWSEGDTCCPEPQEGVTGDACAGSTQCNGITGGTPECLTAMMGMLTFEGGYCSASDCTPDESCDDQNGICVDMMGNRVCLRQCTESSECRESEGYSCASLPIMPGATYCMPEMSMP